MERASALILFLAPRSRLLIAIVSLLLLCCPVQAVFVQGLDVYNGSGAVNWTSVKNSGIDFAFVKATEGIDFVDLRFNTNMQGARNAGVMVGGYHFCRLDSYATDPNDAINEANDFLDVILPHYRTGLHLPPVADVERFPPLGSTEEYRQFTSAWVKKFSDTIYSALGVRPIIYQSLSKANTYYTPAIASTHELWLAWWKNSTANPPVASDTPLWGDWQFWQWTAEGTVTGVPGNSLGHVDRNLFNGSIAQLSKLQIGNDGAIPGDFNRDGAVNAADYLVWEKTKDSIVPIYSGADASGNARIDAADIALWRTNFGRTSGSGFVAGEAGVPEPSALALAVIGFCFATICPRRPK